MRMRVIITDPEERYSVAVQIVKECKVVLFETNFEPELQQDFIIALDEHFDLFNVRKTPQGCTLMAKLGVKNDASECTGSIILSTMLIFEKNIVL